MDLLGWLLEGDPAIRWRVLRDLTDAPAAEVTRERERVATEGWGARLLQAQNDDGGWGDGDYSPKWTSTTYTLLHLLWLGLPAGHPAAMRGCDRLWQWQGRWRTPETCVTAIVVNISSSFEYAADRLPGLVDHLLAEQQTDGGWNCASRGDRSRHSSFHTTIQALEALHAYRGTRDTTEAQQRAREFFLNHRLYRSHRTGETAIRASTRFPAFPEWHFDVLRGLEHFAATESTRDDRLTDAIGVLRDARHRDGRWSTYAQYPGRQFFTLEPSGPSRWTTARALRALHWWNPDTIAEARP
jgi:hypothetical protein